MKIATKLALIATFAVTATATAATAAIAPNIVSETARTVQGGRQIQVLVAQAEIKTDINPSNIAVATGGGMLGGLLAASQNAKRAKKAEAAIEPLRAALTGFDVDGLALQTAKDALTGTQWLQSAAISMGKDSSPVGKSGVLDGAATGQVAFIEYSYDVSPDFSSIRVAENIQFANKAMPVGKAVKPEARVANKNLAYAFTITSIVSLSSFSEDIDSNTMAWSANGAKAARAALSMAFAKLKELTPRALALTAADIQTMSGKDKPKGGAGGFGGRIQETGPTGTLLWTGGFVHAQTLIVN
jgi:hypothetical protein